MKKNLIAGNWKMNLSVEQARQLLHDLKATCQSDKVDYLVCPSFVYLPMAQEMLADSCIRVGAQNVADQDSGAYTGEVSASMLKDSGCDYVIVGHSERRHIYKECNGLVAARFFSAIKNQLIPILCVGETLDEREAGDAEAVVAKQLDVVLSQYQSGEFVIAYEPVWAIGTGMSASPEDAQSIHGFIRKKLQEKDAVLAESVRILYGGSVKPENAGDLFAMPDINGALIGGASLNAQSFSAIAKRGE